MDARELKEIVDMVKSSASSERAICTSSFTGENSGSVQQIKPGPSDLHFADIVNPTNAAVWLQVFDSLAEDVTLGSTSPAQSYWCPANGARDIELRGLLQLNEGLSIAVTTNREGDAAPGSPISINLIYR